jgi:hypothetical protein
MADQTAIFPAREGWTESDALAGSGLKHEDIQAFADLFWSATAWFGLPWDQAPEEQAVIVRHGEGGSAMLDLLVFSPRITNPVVADVPVAWIWDDASAFRRGLQQASEVAAAMRERNGARMFEIARFVSEWPTSRLVTTLRRFLARTRPAFVVMPMPEIIPQAAATIGACRVSPGSNPSAISTAGVVAHNLAGVEGVTAARHALLNTAGVVSVGDSVDVGGSAGTVESEDMISDSVFVKLPDASTLLGTRPFSHVVVSPAPGVGTAVSFDGAGSGSNSTVVTGAPLTLLNPHPLLQRVLYTNPVTLPGDSGCALFDPADQLLGFCIGTSAITSPVTFSAWAWADSVFQAHQLR